MCGLLITNPSMPFFYSARTPICSYFIYFFTFLLTFSLLPLAAALTCMDDRCRYPV